MNCSLLNENNCKIYTRWTLLNKFRPLTSMYECTRLSSKRLNFIKEIMFRGILSVRVNVIVSLAERIGKNADSEQIYFQLRLFNSLE